MPARFCVSVHISMSASLLGTMIEPLGRRTPGLAERVMLLLRSLRLLLLVPLARMGTNVTSAGSLRSSGMPLARRVDD